MKRAFALWLAALVVCVDGSLMAKDTDWRRLGGLESRFITDLHVSSNGMFYARVSRGSYRWVNVYRSRDMGSTWESLADQLGEGVTMQSFAEDSRQRQYLGTSKGLFVSSDGGDNWRAIPTPDNVTAKLFNIRALAIDEEDNIFVSSSQYGNYRSFDGGKSWLPMNLSWRYTKTTVSNFGILSNGDVVAAPDRRKMVYYSSDKGRSWIERPLPTDIIDHTSETSLCVDSRDRIFVTQYLGVIYCSENNGKHWHHVTLPCEDSRTFGNLFTNDSDHLFVLVGGPGLRIPYRSTDGGISWMQGEITLPDWKVIKKIRQDSEGNLYLITGDGLYRAAQNTVNTYVSCTTVKGQIYLDLNGDCLQQRAKEPGIPKVGVRTMPSGVVTLADQAGKYSFQVPMSDFNIEFRGGSGWRQVCPAINEPHQVDADSSKSTIHVFDFAVEPTRWYADLDASLSGHRAIPGEEGCYTISFHNSGTLPFTGRLIFQHDEMLHIESISLEPLTQTATTLEWKIEELPIFARRTIKLKTRLDRQAPSGMQLCSSVAKMHESSESSEIDKFCYEVRDSHDPNDINVWPTGRIGVEDKALTYTIRFQNTGTAPARRVIVLDTLPVHLDIESLVPGVVSHKHTLDIDKGNILRWTFDNINLPDSNANEAASHGFIKFRILRVEDMPLGTEIPNRAAIYFDYNDPVITNEVVNTLVGEATSVASEAEAAIRLYPNPADEHLRIESTSALKGPVKLRDLTGRLVMSIEPQHSNHARLALSALAAGQYYLHLSTATGNVVKMVTVRH